MDSDWEKFQTSYLTASPQVKLLVDSDKIPGLAKKLIENKLTPLRELRPIILALTNFVLGIIDIKKLGEHLRIPNEHALSFAEEMKSFMSISQDKGGPTVPPAPKDTREELELRPASAPPRVPPPPQPTPPPTGGDRPLTREEVLRAITPKRTMATDIESVRKEQEGKQAPFTDMR